MKKSHTLSLAGLVLPVLAGLSACSGTTPAPAETAKHVKARGVPLSVGAGANTETPTSAKTPEAANPQDKGTPQEQQEKALLADAIRKARRNLEIGNWIGALQEAVFALRVDPNNAEATDIANRARELLGETPPSTKAREIQGFVRFRIEQQRDEARAIREAQQGDAHMAAGQFSKAVESFQRAVTVLRYSPFFSKGSALYASLNAKLGQAQDARKRAIAAKITRDQVASEAEQKRQERIQALARATRVKRLFEDANRSFQRGQYESCLRSLKMVLREDPFHRNALALSDLASRARHDTQMDRLRREWKATWAKTFDDLNMEDVPMTDIYRYNLERWLITSQRQPLEFKSEESSESPEEAAILAKLSSVKQEFNFSEATLQDWAKYFSDRTEVNFVVTKGAAELDSDTTTLKAFELPPMTATQALDIIGEQTGVKWRVMHGIVQLVTPEFAGGRMYLKQYDVRDIVEGVPDKPGIEPKLTVPGEEEMIIDPDEEVRPTVVDAGKLVDLIRDNIGGESWDDGKASIAELKGTLLVRHTKDVHTEIHKLLTDLREAVGIQVDVESRFLKVTDNFLEDIGVDFRGLGNNASEGIPGRGLSSRPNVGFDDFGRRENINPASPGEIGTGSEPGIFYDDGGDGDIFGRTEHLFDNTLGDKDGLLPSGGFSLQYAYLDDAEVEMIFRAVTKNDRSQEITAPRLLVYNNTRANMSVARQTTYIKDFDVEIAQAAAVANPVIGVVRDGVSLDVRPVVSADRKFITMELRPTVLDLVLPIPTFVTTLGVGQPIKIQLPQTVLKMVRTTVTLPDGGTVLLGGMKISNKQRLEAGIPILSKLPIISFLFGRKGTSVTNSNLLILIRASIVIPSEHEPAYIPNPLEDLIGGGK
jgi:Flp pilus assembly secretin CpaC/tetratricopeptide (TPR) repeat protein